MKHIAVDLGGTKIEIILCGENVLNILERKRVPTQQYESYERLLRQISGLIKEYLELSEDEMIIGMGIPAGFTAPLCSRNEEDSEYLAASRFHNHFFRAATIRSSMQNYAFGEFDKFKMVQK